MRWRLSNRTDPKARELADRHYNRQKIGSTGFAPPGKALVLVAGPIDSPNAFWITSYPKAEYVRHAWAGAWVCSAFRNESGVRSSLLIIDAIKATRAVFGAPPPLGMITFVNRGKVRSSNPGYCYKCAGFSICGETKGGLLALQLRPEFMPPPSPPEAPAPGIRSVYEGRARSNQLQLFRQY